ncbi:MAG: hypothetical protein ACR2IJ_10670 [Fluviibacter sp.]
MKNYRSSRYRQQLVLAAEEAAARILVEHRTGALFPHHQTVKLLRAAWLAGHKAARQETKDE